MFKSYYVVWKPMSDEEIEALSEEFKSYYVVWKRNPKENIIPARFSLNRTM